MNILDELEAGEIKRKEDLVVKNLRKILNPEIVKEDSESCEIDSRSELEQHRGHINKLKEELTQAKLQFEAEYKRRVFIEEILRKIIS